MECGEEGEMGNKAGEAKEGKLLERERKEKEKEVGEGRLLFLVVW